MAQVSDKSESDPAPELRVASAAGLVAARHRPAGNDGGGSMAFYSIDDPVLWGRSAARLDEIAAKGGLDGISVANLVLGDPEKDAPSATLLRMASGYVLPRHGHDCYRLEVIVKGSIHVGDEVYGAGTIMFSEPGTFYGPHVAGPEGCVTIEIFSNFEASHVTMMESTSGPVKCDIWTAAGSQLMMDLVNEQRRRAPVR
jgi:hypothetical protein